MLRERSWTQRELAAKTRLSESAVSLFLRGKIMPGPKSLLAIQRAILEGDPSDVCRRRWEEMMARPAAEAGFALRDVAGTLQQYMQQGGRQGRRARRAIPAEVASAFEKGAADPVENIVADVLRQLAGASAGGAAVPTLNRVRDAIARRAPEMVLKLQCSEIQKRINRFVLTAG